jgi:hypothetical protein
VTANRGPIGRAPSPLRRDDQYVVALERLGLGRDEAERRVADQRARRLLSEPPEPTDPALGRPSGDPDAGVGR